MAKKMCNVCGEKPATVPDRNRLGRPINKVCSSCHALLLKGDIARIAKLRAARDEQSGVIVGKESVKCKRCGGEMKPGQALESTLVGEPDDIDGCVTVSPGGPGKLVPCMKCAECGWSVTVGESK